MNSKLENIKKLEVSKPLKLDCGKTINNFPLAYETYGKLNENKDNAILVFHALTGDQFVAETNPVTNKEGWWVTAVGPGKAIDTKNVFKTLTWKPSYIVKATSSSVEYPAFNNGEVSIS